MGRRRQGSDFRLLEGRDRAAQAEGLFDIAEFCRRACRLRASPERRAEQTRRRRTITSTASTRRRSCSRRMANRTAAVFYISGTISSRESGWTNSSSSSLRKCRSLLTRNGYHGGFTGTVERTAGVNMFNLYADPQEDNSIGARHIPTSCRTGDGGRALQGSVEEIPAQGADRVPMIGGAAKGIRTPSFRP